MCLTLYVVVICFLLLPFFPFSDVDHVSPPHNLYGVMALMVFGDLPNYYRIKNYILIDKRLYLKYTNKQNCKILRKQTFSSDHDIKSNQTQRRFRIVTSQSLIRHDTLSAVQLKGVVCF